MPTALKQKNIINVKRYVTDKKGHKVAAILDIKELTKIENLLEDLSDLKAIKNRISEPSEDYKAYSRKRKSRLNV